MFYEQWLRYVSDEKLGEMYAIQAIVDFYKAGIILDEINRRKRDGQCNSTQNNKPA